MKEYGVSVLQFIITGRKQELFNLLSLLSAEDSNQLITEFYLIEEFFLKLSKSTFTDYSGLNTSVVTDGVVQNITPNDYIKAHRKYVLGKNVPMQELMSESTFEACSKQVVERAYLKHADLALVPLTDRQKLFISELASHAYKMYTVMKFDTLKQFSDTTDSANLLLNTKYGNTYAILDKYSALNVYDAETLRQTQSKLGKILASLSDVETHKIQPLISAIREIIECTSSPNSLLALIGSSIEYMQMEEFIEVLAILRDKANLPGLDAHAELFSEALTNISSNVVADLEPERKRHLMLLERDLDSVLHYEKGR